MTAITNLFLPVADPLASARIYAALLGRNPAEESPTFVIFPPAGGGIALGLWRTDGITPAVATVAGGMEVGFKVASFEAVDAAFEAWAGLGLAVALPPTDLDFGRSFVALDPDGHRLRVYALGPDA